MIDVNGYVLRNYQITQNENIKGPSHGISCTVLYRVESSYMNKLLADFS